MDENKNIEQGKFDQSDRIENLSEEDFLNDAEFFDSVDSWGNMIIASK